MLSAPSTAIWCGLRPVIRLSSSRWGQWRLVKDGKILTDVGGAVAERRKLSFSGIVTVALAIDERGNLASDPEIETTGIPEVANDGENIAELALDAVEAALKSLPRASGAIRWRFRRRCAALCAAPSTDVWDKKPICQVFVLEV
jgi:ribonuclease J